MQMQFFFIIILPSNTNKKLVLHLVLGSEHCEFRFRFCTVQNSLEVLLSASFVLGSKQRNFRFRFRTVRLSFSFVSCKFRLAFFTTQVSP